MSSSPCIIKTACVWQNYLDVFVKTVLFDILVKYVLFDSQTWFAFGFFLSKSGFKIINV